jgi:tetratricopeptide (TPR) repeat protein
MNNNYTNSDLLVQYLDSELSTEEKLRVENELKNNTAMQQELQNLILAKDAVKTYGVKQKVATIHKQMMSEMATTAMPKKTGIVRSIARISMRIAASVLIIMLGLGIYQYATISPDKLFAENYQPYALSVSRGAADTDAMEKAYQQKDYAAVINQFAALPEAGQKENFFAGQSYLASNNYAKAVECFKKVAALNVAENKNIFKDDAEYYLALSYLKNNEFRFAYPIFINIHNNPKHLYNDKITNSVIRQITLLNWKY